MNQPARDSALTARGKSRHGIRPSLHPGGRRCDSGTYSWYAPESRLVRRAQERSRCSRDFHHGLLTDGNRKRRMGNTWLILVILLCGLPVNAAAPPGPKFGPAVHPTFSQLESRLLEWEKAHPKVMELRRLGTTAQGRPLLAAVLTDPDSPADQKEHVLITALHCGAERSAATGIFYLMGWLLKGSPGAREILRGQVIAFMPVVNPDGYVSGSLRNSHNRDTYKEWNRKGPLDPEQMPEAVAVKSLMDEFQAEVHADYHGTGMQFRGYIMAENSGAAYSNISLKSYKHEIIRQMDKAALAEGYPSDELEQDAERIYWGPELEELGPKLWSGRPLYYAATYGYEHFHTLAFANENAWERSSFLRHRRLLEIGQEIWPGEYYPGYPTRVILKNELHFVTAYGETAAARRRSRVELWNKQGQIVTALNNPQTEGMVLFVCSTTGRAARRWLSDKSLPRFAQRIGEHKNIDAGPIQAALADHPDAGAQFKAHLLLMSGRADESELPPVMESDPIENGLSFRLRIPYPKARISEVRVNGRRAPVSPRAGYLTWVARGFTYVQVNIPPDRSREEDLFVVTCLYDPGEERVFGLGWQEETP